MASQHSKILTYLRHVHGDGMSDRELLRRFVATKDEDSFAELVRRHGPLVLAVGRCILGNTHDAEDVLQAAFLVLARKAASIRQGRSVAVWLRQVARHLALRQLQKESRRREVEGEKVRMLSGGEPMKEIDLRELNRLIIEEEVPRLPERYQEIVLLCWCQGKTKEEVARQIGMSQRTVFYRQERARKLLMQRLARRGVTLSAALLPVALSQQVASAGFKASLIGTITRSAIDFAAVREIGKQLQSKAVILANEFLRGFRPRKLSWVLLFVLATGTTAGGIAVSVPRPQTQADSAIQENHQEKGDKDRALTQKLHTIVPRILRSVEHMIPGSKAKPVSDNVENGKAMVEAKWYPFPAFLPNLHVDLRIGYKLEARELGLWYRLGKEQPWTPKDPDRPAYATLGGQEWLVMGREEFKAIKSAFETLQDEPR